MLIHTEPYQTYYIQDAQNTKLNILKHTKPHTKHTKTYKTILKHAKHSRNTQRVRRAPRAQRNAARAGAGMRQPGGSVVKVDYKHL